MSRDQLLRHLLAEPLRGARVALQLYGMPAPEIATALAAAGAEVLQVPVYQWRTPDDPGPALHLAQAAIDGRIHAVTFTAAPAVTNLFALAGGAGIDGSLRDAFNRKRVVAACVGPVCPGGIRGRDRGPAGSRCRPPRPHGAGALGVPARQPPHGAHGRGRRRPTGAHRRGGRGPGAAELPGTGLLDTLAARPGTVFSRPALVKEVWSSTGADPHAVEVAIARLRPRLGPAGAALVAVPGRGYRLQP